MYAVLIILILLSGFFSGSETAFFSLSEIRLRSMVSRKIRGANLVAKLKSNPQKLLITILIGNNLVNIAAASLATVIAIDYFGSRAVGIATGVMTLLILIFGEITPKSLSIKYKETITCLSARPIFYLEKILFPVSWLLGKMLPKEGLKIPAVSEKDLEIMTSLGVEEGTVEQSEAEIIRNVFRLNDITAEDVMTPRTEMLALNGNNSLKNVQKKIIDSPFSRIPIFEKSIDHIIGILYKDDALINLYKGNLDVKLKDIVRETIFVPESKFIDELMSEFQQKHIHMAIVVNEYGEVVGIVTLEDLIEELVGEIVDETDISPTLIKRIDKNSILVEGKTEIKHINSFFNILLDKRYNTISGFIEDKLGRIPKRGERVKIGEDITLIVKEASKKAIKNVVIRKKKVEE